MIKPLAKPVTRCTHFADPGDDYRAGLTGAAGVNAAAEEGAGVDPTGSGEAPAGSAGAGAGGTMTDAPGDNITDGLSSAGGAARPGEARGAMLVCPGTAVPLPAPTVRRYRGEVLAGDQICLEPLHDISRFLNRGRPNRAYALPACRLIAGSAGRGFGRGLRRR